MTPNQNQDSIPAVPKGFHRTLRYTARILFKLLHDIRIVGQEHVPESGPVILASNHPTYLDPVFIICGLKRQVRFLAWERLFQIPLLRQMMIWYGTIPVNLDRPGRGSFQAAVKVLRAGEVFGIFPEGGRSDFGYMNPLKSGVARLALLTGAPIVPISVIGANRVWPKRNLLPTPGGPVIIEFHPPIRLDPGEIKKRRRDKAFEKGIVTEVMTTINQKLLPALRKTRREDMVYKRPSRIWNWELEGLPLFFGVWLAVLYLLQIREVPASILSWGVGYAAYYTSYSFIGRKNRWRVGLWNIAPWIILCGLGLQLTGSLHVQAYVSSAVFVVLMAWMATFRFRAYKRFRAWFLPLAYIGLFVWSIVAI